MTTLTGKNGKPLGKPFVIPSLKQLNNSSSTKNIPIQIAVSKKATPVVDKVIPSGKKVLANSKATVVAATDVKSKPQLKTVDVKSSVKTTPSDKPNVEKKSPNQSNNKNNVKNNVQSSKDFKKNSIVTEINWWDTTTDLPVPLVTFPDEQPWYSVYAPFVGEQIESNNDSKLDEKKCATIALSVSAAYTAAVADHAKAQGGGKGNTDQKWINDVIQSGTLSDKVAALALRVQEAPFYQLETLDLLVGMACKKEQRTSQLALEAIKDLLMNNLLPDRKLTAFKSSLLFHPSMTLPTAVVLWFEGQLKIRIERVMEALDNGLKSTVDFFKKQCLETASSLLMSKPEQEARLLTMIVNKLGDPSSKICSKCIEVLKNVVRVHPAMKLVIVREVRQFIYRPNIKLKSIFNGVIFLSQVTLAHGDHLVAAQLVECYVSLFEKAVKEDELGSRLLSALLTGINKSFPFLDNIEPIAKYADSLFRLVHTASFTSSTQALMLLSHIAITTSHDEEKKKKQQQLAAKKKKAETAGSSADDSMITDGDDEEEEDFSEGEEEGAAQDSGDVGSDLMKRYYRALYAKLLSDQVTSRAKNTLLLNLMFRSIKRDPSDHR